MTWHELPELPRPDVEVLAEVEGYEKLDTHYMVVKYMFNHAFYPSAFYAASSISVKRWAYIEEE